MKELTFDCLIIGAGPAGLSAALYAARAGLKTALTDSSAIGGAPFNFCEIENYPGFSKIEGYKLCEKFENHIDSFGVEKFPYEEIKNIDLISKKIETSDKILKSKTIIIATGAKPKKLNIKGEQEFFSKGVSYCAVCDGAFYKDKVVTVVGGGNSALEEALYLARFAKKVYLVHRRDEFRADKIVQKRVFENKKIELILNAAPIEIQGDDKVRSIKLSNGKTLETQGVFPYIGLSANTNMFNSQIALDKDGFIITDCSMKTSLEGIWAIGDVRTTPLRQVVTAAADGAIAGVEAGKYLSGIKEIIHESISI